MSGARNDSAWGWRITSRDVSSTALDIPPAAPHARDRTPLSGPTKARPLTVSIAISRSLPTLGSTTARLTASCGMYGIESARSNAPAVTSSGRIRCERSTIGRCRSDSTPSPRGRFRPIRCRVRSRLGRRSAALTTSPPSMLARSVRRKGSWSRSPSSSEKQSTCARFSRASALRTRSPIARPVELARIDPNVSYRARRGQDTLSRDGGGTRLPLPPSSTCAWSKRSAQELRHKGQEVKEWMSRVQRR